MFLVAAFCVDVFRPSTVHVFFFQIPTWRSNCWTQKASESGRRRKRPWRTPISIRTTMNPSSSWLNKVSRPSDVESTVVLPWTKLDDLVPRCAYREKTFLFTYCYQSDKPNNSKTELTTCVCLLSDSIRFVTRKPVLHFWNFAKLNYCISSNEQERKYRYLVVRNSAAIKCNLKCFRIETRMCAAIMQMFLLRIHEMNAQL